MIKYYDPMLFTSTPEHPETAGILTVLTEPVDGEILRHAVESLRDRYPYFYIRAEVNGTDLISVPNPLPMAVRNSLETVPLLSKEANYHWLAFRYSGNTFILDFSHILADGSGIFPFFKSVLYCYLKEKTGADLAPEGFRLPGQTLSALEAGDPFPELDLKSAKPFYTKKPVLNFYRVKKKLKDNDRKKRNFYLRLPEAPVMKLCGENDGSPNVLLAVLLAKSVWRMDPESRQPVTTAIAINHKAILGNHESWQTFSDTAIVDYPKKIAGWSLSKLCTITRGQIMLQVQPENSASYIKNIKRAQEMLHPLPLPLKAELMKNVLNISRATACVSYTNSRSFGPLDPYISQIYGLSDPDVFDIQIEVICVNHCFFLQFAQKFSSRDFYEAFLQELEEAGIPAEETGEDCGILPGVRYDGIDAMKPVAESMRDGITDAGNTAAKIFDEAMCLMKLK